MLKDTSRGLIDLGDSDGWWVLRMKPAAGSQSEKQSAQYVLYNR